MAKTTEIRWMGRPEPHDYPAALSFLTLVFAPEEAKELVKRLKSAPMSEFKAKDIFRTAELSLLGVSNSHVKKNRRKIWRE